MAKSQYTKSWKTDRSLFLGQKRWENKINQRQKRIDNYRKLVVETGIESQRLREIDLKEAELKKKLENARDCSRESLSKSKLRKRAWHRERRVERDHWKKVLAKQGLSSVDQDLKINSKENDTAAPEGSAEDVISSYRRQKFHLPYMDDESDVTSEANTFVSRPSRKRNSPQSLPAETEQKIVHQDSVVQFLGFNQNEDLGSETSKNALQSYKNKTGRFLKTRTSKGQPIMRNKVTDLYLKAKNKYAT